MHTHLSLYIAGDFDKALFERQYDPVDTLSYKNKPSEVAKLMIINQIAYLYNWSRSFSVSFQILAQLDGLKASLY